MANPMAVFKAMADSEPYPVRAFFALANNTLMSFANTKRIYDGLMKQDLIVAYEALQDDSRPLTPQQQMIVKTVMDHGQLGDVMRDTTGEYLLGLERYLRRSSSRVLKVKRTVRSPTISALSIFFHDPDSGDGRPCRGSRKTRPTSSAVTGDPSENFASGRSVNSTHERSSGTSIDSARTP